MGWGWMLIATIAAASTPPDAHGRVAAGHRHFQAGEFEAALTEYRRAQRMGNVRETSWQIGVTLVQLGRTEDALEAFAVAQRSAPGLEQPLQRFYRAVACLKARLWQCADELLGPLASSLKGPMAAHATALKNLVD